MEASYCLDTDVLVDLLRGREPSVSAVRALEHSLAEIATTAITAFELYYGALKSSRVQENMAAVRELLDRLEVIDLDEGVAELAARHLARLESRGQPIELADLFIGCAALSRGMALVTRNVDHFRRIEGLRVATPEEILKQPSDSRRDRQTSASPSRAKGSPRGQR